MLTPQSWQKKITSFSAHLLLQFIRLFQVLRFTVPTSQISLGFVAVHISDLFKDQQEVVTVHWAIVQIKHHLFSRLSLTFKLPLNPLRILLFYLAASSSSSDKSERTQPWRSCRGGRGPFHHPEIEHQNILFQVCFAGQNWKQKRKKD